MRGHLPLYASGGRDAVISCPRVGVFVFFLERGERGVGVNLRGSEAFVAKQLFHGFEVRSMVEHQRGKRVAQHVGAFLLANGYHREIFPHNRRHFCLIDGPAVFVDEQRATVAAHDVAAGGHVFG